MRSEGLGLRTQGGLLGNGAGRTLPPGHRGRENRRNKQRPRQHRARHEGAPVPLHSLAQPVGPGGGPRLHRLVVQRSLDILRQRTDRLVAPHPVLLEALEDDPVEVAFQLAAQPGDIAATPLGGAGLLGLSKGIQSGRRSRRRRIAQRAAHAFQPVLEDVDAVERRLPHQQFIQQHPQAVDVRTRIDVDAAELGLLRAHVRRRPDQSMEPSDERLVRQRLPRGLRDPEVDHLRHRDVVIDRHEDVRRLDVAMDDALLVRVLDGVANLDEQPQTIPRRKAPFIAEVRDAHTPDQFHDEERPSGLRGPAVENTGDVRMIHQRQRLPFRLEPRHHAAGVHARLQDLERDTPSHGIPLLGQIHHTASTLPDLLQQGVAPDAHARPFHHRSRRHHVWIHRRRRRGRYAGKDVLRIAGRIQQRLDPSTQDGVGTTLLAQERHTGFARKIERCLEHRAFPDRVPCRCVQLLHSGSMRRPRTVWAKISSFGPTSLGDPRSTTRGRTPNGASRSVPEF